MTATQLKPTHLPKSIKTKKATTARRVQELLLDIASAMHAIRCEQARVRRADAG